MQFIHIKDLSFTGTDKTDHLISVMIHTESTNSGQDKVSMLLSANLYKQ